MFLTGQGWEGEVTFLRKVPEHAHKAKMVDNRCVFLHLGQGEGMSARALNKGVSMHMAHTQENMLAMQCKSINEWQYQFPSVPYLNM